MAKQAAPQPEVEPREYPWVWDKDLAVYRLDESAEVAWVEGFEPLPAGGSLLRSAFRCIHRVVARQPSIASLIWKYFHDCGARGATADEVLEHFPGWPYQTATARINGLKNNGLLVRDPLSRVRKTRKGRPAEVWVATKEHFNAATYHEKRQARPAPKVISSISSEEKAVLAACYDYRRHPFDDSKESNDKAAALLNTVFDRIIDLPEDQACEPG